LTETSRLADVVLPVPSPLARRHLDVVFGNLAIRNTARYSPPIMPLGPGDLDESAILLRLTAMAFAIASGQPEPATSDVDDLVAADVAQQASDDTASRGHGLPVSEILAAVGPLRGLDRLLDLRIRSGPYGDGFGRFPDGLTLAAVIGAPHGIDLGPLSPRLPEVLRTPTGRIEVAPDILLQALAGLRPLLDEPPVVPEFVLVGRRQLRSNNSWMHNVPTLAGGSNQCTVLMHPDDAARIGVVDGAPLRVTTSTGSVVAPAAVTDDVRRGVICMPHGWGHVNDGTWGQTARASAGANVNLIVSSDSIDPLAGTSSLAGMAVEVRPA
jgi:anaerobic selenocysteine-containing dehydrogenase